MDVFMQILLFNWKTKQNKTKLNKTELTDRTSTFPIGASVVQNLANVLTDDELVIIIIIVINIINNIYSLQM